ncbi:MAG: hypothetical protein FWC50_13580, partial [Planctomycetaceae bacterium]|nr:hypothetical protein [Planctomycetaceae bacterium]
MLEIKIKRVRFIADLAEINKTFYFMKFSHFGAIGRHGGVLHFFSPPQYCLCFCPCINFFKTLRLTVS